MSITPWMSFSYNDGFGFVSVRLSYANPASVLWQGKFETFNNNGVAIESSHLEYKEYKETIAVLLMSLSFCIFAFFYQN